MLHAGERVGGGIELGSEKHFDFMGPDVGHVVLVVQLVDVAEELVNERTARVVIDGLRIADLFDAGVAHDDDLVGGIGEYEHTWRMAHVRGPEGVVVSVSQRVGRCVVAVTMLSISSTSG